MLKLKLQYFGHLMCKTYSFEKTLMLGKIEGRWRRGQQGMRWLDGITNSMDMSLINSGSWQWTGKPGVLQSMGSQIWTRLSDWTVRSIARSWRIFCDPRDCSLSGSLVHGILKARILEWVAISSSRGYSWLRDRTHVFCTSCTGRWILYHCTFWEALTRYIIGKYLIPFCGLPFHFLNDAFWSTQVLNFNDVQFIYFSHELVVLSVNLRNQCPIQGHKGLQLYSFLRIVLALTFTSLVCFESVFHICEVGAQLHASACGYPVDSCLIFLNAQWQDCTGSRGRLCHEYCSLLMPMGLKSTDQIWLYEDKIQEEGLHHLRAFQGSRTLSEHWAHRPSYH